VITLTDLFIYAVYIRRLAYTMFLSLLKWHILYQILHWILRKAIKLFCCIFWLVFYVFYFNLYAGLVHKLGNHTEEFGITDSVIFSDGILLTSAFCLDTGLGYINGMTHTTSGRERSEMVFCRPTTHIMTG
jgi:hypothetical protein